VKENESQLERDGGKEEKIEKKHRKPNQITIIMRIMRIIERT
jgi:hypothetical protein